MYSFINRSLIFRSSLNRLPIRLYNAASSPIERIDQLDFLKHQLENISSDVDWNAFKNNLLTISKFGKINSKNVDGVLIKIMVAEKKFDAALSYAEYLKKRTDEMSIGPINGLLNMYYVLSQTRKLTRDEKKYILDTYEYLYRKYKVLDYRTSENLINALCAIDEWEKGLKVLEEIHLSSTPPHISYSQLIATLFRCKKKKKAFELIKQSLYNKRHLLFCAYKDWIDFIHKTYKDKNILKYLDEILEHISINCAVVDEQTATLLRDTFRSLQCNAEFTTIKKQNGQCLKCKESLQLLTLTKEEFLLLQQNIEEKLIVGSDLFLKSKPEELKQFLDFVKKTAPYDIVIDSLNVAYAVGKMHSDRLSLLLSVVEYFKEQNKKVLLLGRKHMLKWHKTSMNKLRRNALCFFTDDLSQDDPYFLAAAIKSGPHTDIVSKDLLRTHTFQLKDENLRFIFKKWQWQHQWRVYTNLKKEFSIQPPLKFTPCAQKGLCWHIPYESNETQKSETFNDGTPDLSSWLCIQTKQIKLNNL